MEFVVDEPGEYLLDIIEKETPKKIKLSERFIYVVISLLEVIWAGFTFTWNNSWKEEVSAYCIKASVKLTVNSNRTIAIELNSSKFDKGLQKWCKPSVVIKKVSANQIFLKYVFNKEDFYHAFFHYSCKLFFVFFLLFLVGILATIAGIQTDNLSAIIIPLIFCSAFIVGFIAKVSLEKRKLDKIIMDASVHCPPR